VIMLSDLKASLLAGSAEEYLARLYERIERSKLNAFTTLAKERALQEARSFDTSRIAYPPRESRPTAAPGSCRGTSPPLMPM